MISDEQAARRWRLILGGEEADGIGCSLNLSDARMDKALQALYDSDRKGGLGSSAPNVSRWLGDIREYFPASVVQVLQRDAIDRLDMTRLLMEPEILESLQPDVFLGGHTGFFRMEEKRARLGQGGANPCVEEGAAAFKAHVASRKQAYQKQLEDERAGQAR